MLPLNQAISLSLFPKRLATPFLTGITKLKPPNNNKLMVTRIKLMKNYNTK